MFLNNNYLKRMELYNINIVTVMHQHMQFIEVAGHVCMHVRALDSTCTCT